MATLCVPHAGAVGRLALVEVFFHEPEDGTELKGWDSILLVG
jgi:hypothetical protein